MNFNVPEFILDSPVSSYRKMLKLMFSDLWHNSEAIDTLERNWPDLIAEYKTAWETASVTFQREYKDPKGMTAVGKTKEQREEIKKQKAKIKAHNDYMFKKVKSAKAVYEKMMQRKEIFDQFRTKHK